MVRANCNVSGTATTMKSQTQESRGSFFSAQKVFRTNLLHPENIVRVCQQGPCLHTIHIFRRLSLLFIPGKRASFFFLSSSLLFRYQHIHRKHTPTCLLNHPQCIYIYICVFFFISKFVFFTSLLSSDNVVPFQWLNRMFFMLHARTRIPIFPHTKNNNSVDAEKEKKKTKNRDKNCAHIMFPEKTTDETESKAKRIKLISHFCCWSACTLDDLCGCGWNNSRLEFFFSCFCWVVVVE